MPSWTNNLQQDHRWTGRQLIGVDDATDEEVNSENEEPCTTQKPSGSVARRILLADDALSEDADQDDSACAMATSSQLSLGSQWQTPPSQTRIGKRTLLTVEEMEYSDEDFQEQDEEDDNDQQFSEPTDPFQNLSISVPSGEDELVLDTGPGDIMMDLERESPMERETDVHMQQAETSPANAYASNSETELDIDVDMNTSHAVVEGPTQTRTTSAVIASQDPVVDSGRVQETQGQDEERSSSQANTLKRRKKAIKYLERVCLDLLQQLSECVKLEVKRARQDVGLDDSGSEEDDLEALQGDRGAADTKADKEGTEQAKTGEISIPLLNRASGDLKYLKYPRKASQTDGSTSLALARFLRVCTLMHESHVNDTTVTKRDIYYKDVNLFGKQSVVDALIDDIIASVGLKLSDFNVVASPKGLMAASKLSFYMNGVAERLGCTPTLIPHDGKITAFDSARSPCWVLVIEKEATFTTLCTSGILSDPELGDGILVTGKGYPDYATLHFLRLVSDWFPSCPIAILVDADAHGLDILSVYQYGSKGMRFTAEAEGLALGDKATWIGVKATEWSSLNLDMDKLIPITEKDTKFAQSMLCEDDLPREWNHMLHLRRKAEIQNLGSVDDTSRSQEMGLICEFVNDANSPPGRIGSRDANLLQTAMHSHALPAANTDCNLECIELDARSQPAGLYAYIKTKLKELISRPDGRN